MDLKVNGIGFQGKKEILYGLTKAADEVYTYSMYMRPHILRLGENKNAAKHEAAAKAYLDMVTRDDYFEKFVSETNKSTLQKSLKKFLEPFDCGIKPTDFFRNFLYETMNKNQIFHSSRKNAAKNLMKRISDL